MILLSLNRTEEFLYQTLLCSICRKRMSDLEEIINHKTSSNIAFSEGINKILSKEWMGDIEKKDSPLYNIKKNYGYDINRNSGFNKKWWEIIRDSILQNTSQWIIGGIIGVIMILLGDFLSGIFLK